jgi:hypothetical protein
MKQSLQFKIELFGTKKPVWRRFIVPETISLKKFHEIIQVVMGWENYHQVRKRKTDLRFTDSVFS